MIEYAKVLVGNLPISADEAIVEKLFNAVTPSVAAINIPKDTKGRNCGHAFVELNSHAAAHDAVQKLSGFDLDGRRLALSIEEMKVQQKSWLHALLPKPKR